MPVFRVTLTAVVDTDNTQVTLITPKQDAEQLAANVQDLIQRRGGLRGFSSPIIKAMAEAQIMKWARELIMRGWINFIPDSKDWKIILKRGD